MIALSIDLQVFFLEKVFNFLPINPILFLADLLNTVDSILGHTEKKSIRVSLRPLGTTIVEVFALKE